MDAVRHLADDRIHDAYVPLVFNGMIGLFHTNNESTEIWEPASKCLADLMMKHTSALWNGFVHYLGHCQLKIEALHIHRGNGNYSVSQKHTGRFFSDYFVSILLFHLSIFCTVLMFAFFILQV